MIPVTKYEVYPKSVTVYARCCSLVNRKLINIKYYKHLKQTHISICTFHWVKFLHEHILFILK